MANDLRRLAQMVYNMNTVKRVHRIRITQQAITEGTSAENFNLLTCDDDPNYDLTTDGTNVAECEPGCKIVAIQLVMTVHSVPAASRLIEWTIGRDPDATLTTGLGMPTLYTSDVSTTTIVTRKNVWAAGHMVGLDKLGANINVNVSRKALARASRMADGDIIRLTFTDDSGGTGNAAFYLRGRIITRGP